LGECLCCKSGPGGFVLGHGRVIIEWADFQKILNSGRGGGGGGFGDWGMGAEFRGVRGGLCPLFHWGMLGVRAFGHKGGVNYGDTQE